MSPSLQLLPNQKNNMDSEQPKVLFLFRKPYASGNYSVEFLFSEIRERLRDKIDSTVFIPRFHSNGFLKRIFTCLEAYVRRGSINLITGDISYVSAFLPQKDTILVVLDCGLIYEPPSFMRWIEELFWYRIPFWRASRVVTISEATKLDLLNITGGDPSKITVIPCFINPIHKRSDKEFCKQKPMLLQVGQSSNKNLTRIIHAIKGLSVHLSIIGTVSHESIELLNEFGIEYSSAVNLTNREVFNKYEECDMLVFPSTYEGFGLPIIEAQTVGRPVITSNTTSMPWVAGGAACIVDPYSVESIRCGILRVVNEDSYRNGLVAAGFENVKRFDPDVVANRYYDLFLQVASAK